MISHPLLDYFFSFSLYLWIKLNDIYTYEVLLLVTWLVSDIYLIYQNKSSNVSWELKYHFLRMPSQSLYSSLFSLFYAISRAVSHCVDVATKFCMYFIFFNVLFCSLNVQYIKDRNIIGLLKVLSMAQKSPHNIYSINTSLIMIKIAYVQFLMKLRFSLWILSLILNLFKKYHFIYGNFMCILYMETSCALN